MVRCGAALWNRRTGTGLVLASCLSFSSLFASFDAPEETPKQLAQLELCQL